MQSVDCLLVILKCLCDGADDCCLGVAAERVLKYTGHFGISVVYECFSVACLTKLVDDIGECQKTAINIRTFSQTQSICLGLAHTLATC